uniref:Uncharacterized protein n=1 Tax=uncultured marine virus TaxID=186617 RepID=A0A0F7L4Y8_9VIRU|nr:hypothetical protein [uncultured marine virus]
MPRRTAKPSPCWSVRVRRSRSVRRRIKSRSKRTRRSRWRLRWVRRRSCKGSPPRRRRGGLLTSNEIVTGV